jgi:hypothetical protein
LENINKIKCVEPFNNRIYFEFADEVSTKDSVLKIPAGLMPKQSKENLNKHVLVRILSFEYNKDVYKSLSNY